MTYPQPGQPGGWPDQSWPNPESYQDPAAQPSSAPYQQPYSAQPYSAQPYAAQPYATPGYQQQPGYAPQPYPVYAQTRSTNGLAIAALVCAIAGLLTCGVGSIIGAVLGHIARKQIAERNEEGDGIALAGIIVGWIITGMYALLALAYFGLWAAIAASVSNSSEYGGTVLGSVLTMVSLAG